MHEERGESPSITYTEKNEAEGKTVKTQTAVRKVGGEMEPLQCERKSVDYIFFFRVFLEVVHFSDNIYLFEVCDDSSGQIFVSLYIMFLRTFLLLEISEISVSTGQYYERNLETSLCCFAYLYS